LRLNGIDALHVRHMMDNSNCAARASHDTTSLPAGCIDLRSGIALE
jgi:hypothetical protein